MPKTLNIMFVLRIAILVTMLATACQARDSIRIRRTACLTPGAVCLADIADLTVTDSTLQQRLQTLIVSQLPPDTTGVAVGLFEIRSALTRAALSLAQFDIYGADQCRLTHKSTPVATDTSADTNPSTTITADSLEVSSLPEILPPVVSLDDSTATLADELAQRVARLAGLDPARLIIEWLDSRDSSCLQTPYRPQRFTIKPDSTGFLGRVRFEIIDHQPEPLHTAGNQPAPSTRHPRSLRVQGDVQYLCESVVAVRSLLPGHLITEQDVKLLPRRVTHLADCGYADRQLVIGQETARAVTPNEVILPRMIKKIQLVRRKQPVNIVSQVGAVCITSKGTALADGAQDELIPVCQLPSQIVVYGRITGSGQVMLGSDPKNVPNLAQAQPLPPDQPLPSAEN